VAVVFRFANSDVSLEVAGPDAWVEEHLRHLSPMLRRAAGAGPAAGAPAEDGVAAGLDGVGLWWRERVPPGSDPGLQDAILLCAYSMRGYRKTVFLSEDIRRCFQVLGREEPRSLLQVLGTMRRDAGLLLSAGRRGEYMMNTTGIARARAILGESRPAAPPPAPRAPGAGAPVPGRPAPSTVDALNLFRD
jgi:hypothetical protein